MLDLYHASRNDLIILVLAQREALADQSRRMAALEAELASQRATIAQLAARIGELLAGGESDEQPNGDEGATAGSQGMPGLKPHPESRCAGFVGQASNRASWRGSSMPWATLRRIASV